MKLVRTAAANVLAFRNRLVSLVAIVLVTTASAVAAAALTSSSHAAADQGVGESVANRSVAVERDIVDPTAPRLTTDLVDRIGAIEHVESVQPRAQVAFGYKGPGVPGVLLRATIERPALAPPLVRTERKSTFPLQAGEVVLPARSGGTDLTPLLGQTLDIQTIARTGSAQGSSTSSHVKVVALFDPSWQIDGPDAAYADDASVVAWAAQLEGVSASEFPSTVGYDELTVVVDSSNDVDGVLRAVQGLGVGATSLQQQLTALPGVLRLVHTAGIALLVVLGAVSVVSAFSVTSALTRQRVREIGILRAVGFRDGWVERMLLVEMAVVSVVSALVGVATGLLVAVGLAHVMRRDAGVAPFVPTVPFPRPVDLVGVVVIVCAVTLLGSWVPARRGVRLAPSAALVDV